GHFQPRLVFLRGGVKNFSVPPLLRQPRFSRRKFFLRFRMQSLMAFFTNAFEVPLSILIEHTQRKVRSILKTVYVVDDIPFSISTFLPTLFTFEMIEPQYLSL